MDTKQRIAALSPAKRRLLELRLQKSGTTDLLTPPPLVPVSRDRELPLSFAQQRLWFLDQLQPDCAFYNVPRLLRISGPLDVESLRRALIAFAQRHEAVRTVFPAVDGKPTQKILPSLDLDCPAIDISPLPEHLREPEMWRIVTEESRRPFDLAHGPLFRASLLRLAAHDHALLMVTHHIISDERTAGILYAELATFYEAFTQATSPRLPELPVQYVDYAVWQREWLQGEVLENSLGYWRKQLSGAPEALSLPFDHPRPAAESFRGSIETRTFSSQLRDAINDLSRRANCTPFITSLAAFAVLLWHYTRQDDVVVGTVVSNRDRVETEKLVGFFLNTLPLRIILSGDPTFTELLARVRQVTFDAYAHQDLPLEKLVEELRPERSATHNSLFQVLFTNRNIERSALAVAGISMQPLDVPTGTSKFDLAAFVGEGPSGLSVSVEYNTDLFLSPTIHRLLEHYRTVLQAAADNPERTISQLPTLPNEERQQVVVAWNATAKDYPLACVHQMFEEQAARTPHAIAVTWDDRTFTYAQLNCKSNQLARYLRTQNVGPGSLVGICMERSLEMIVGVMGALKAGAAYIPLDPDYPKDRLHFMLEDSSAAVLLTQKHLAESLPSDSSRLICLDELDTSHLADQNLNPQATLEDLVYVIFTSGSTGRPKGVCLPHRALSNLLFWQFENSPAGVDTRTLQFTSLSFDVSFQEIFATLCSGGTLVLVDDSLRRDPARLLRYMRDNRINRLFLPFVALQNIAEAAQAEDIPVTLNEVITAGEQLQITPQISEFFRRLPNCTLHNHYGPSESHVVTAYTLSGRPESWPPLPSIGKPIANTQIYILDERLKPVPIGASGELYIGGTALATGYLKRPDLTGERFIPSPFTPGARLYRTGDLARFTNHGNIDYLGRADNQVKIRGHRIEPGEIEAVLHEHPAIATSAVSVREQAGSKYLVAYVVAKPSQKSGLTIPLLRQYLKSRLPDYMVPSAFVLMDELPLTPSGKINRRALPEPDMAQARSTHSVAPRTPTEEILAAIWAHVLNLDAVGVHDDFFDLGGHSLLATQVISRIVQSLEIKLPLRVLFEHPTIAALAQYIHSQSETEKDQVPAIVPVSRDHGLPLSYAQQRLWLLSQIVGSSAAYNAPQVLRIRGPLDSNLLERSINEIVRRHEVLRSTYVLRDDQPIQVVSARVLIPLPCRDLSHLSEVARETEAERLAQEEIRVPFDLVHGPVLRALLFRLAADDHILVMTFHHIVVDGWSMGVFDREMADIYDALAEGRSAPLPDLTIQCADYAAWQRNVMQGEFLQTHLKFWREHLAGAPPMIDVPTDHSRPATAGFEGARLYAQLSPAVVKELKTFSKREGATVFMTMLSAMQVVLAQWTGQRDMVVGTIIANRNHVEIEKLVGCFMNFLPLRTVISEQDTTREILKHSKKTVMQAYAHQDCPFEKIIEEINPQRVASGTSLYNVIFLLQNFPAIAFKNRTLEARFIPMGMEAVHVDLRFAAGENSDGMWIVCDYRRDLFEPATIEHLLSSYTSVLEQLLKNPHGTVTDFKLDPHLVRQAQQSRRRNQKPKLAIAATFTADPLQESVNFWLNELSIPADLRFAPFNQVFQQLLDPQSELSRNQFGLNILLVRLEDWWLAEQAKHDSATFELSSQRFNDNVEQLLTAIRQAVRRSSVPYLVCLCPTWRDTRANPRLAKLLDNAEKQITDTLRCDGAVHTLTSDDLAAWYPVADYEDPDAHELGHVPYTQEFFTALGTAIARRFYRIHTPPHRVIVLDGDQASWGTAPDSAPVGAVHSLSHPLQEFVLTQIGAGMLVCLISNKSEEEFWDSLEPESSMLLRRDHLVNWNMGPQPASEKLKTLSHEIHLPLDSFLFLTGNPRALEEVDANCPDVLCLEIPQNESELSTLLSNVWAFDHLDVTTDRKSYGDFDRYVEDDSSLCTDQQAAEEQAVTGKLDSAGGTPANFKSLGQSK